jgi:aspartate/methionine/tyrosine aminotransferase
MKISRRSVVDPFIVMDVMEAARRREAAGADVIHMEVGQPGTPAPRLAIEALERSLRDNPLGYTVALGSPALRERISRLYRDWHGLDVPSERIVITTGSSAGFLLAFLSLFDAGDRVAIADPGYPSYRNILKGLDLAPVRIECGPNSRFQPTPGLIEAAEAEGGPIQGLLVASPANPTGTMLDADELKALSDACAARGAAFISDEIYHGISYGGRAHTALEVTDDVFVVNSFSKYFSMTGWRVGWLVVPETHLRTVERLAQNFFICAPNASQVVALGALEAEEELEANVAVYAKNREILLEELPKAGFTDFAPCDGAFYLYADISEMTDDSRAFCERMLAEAGVAVTPGHDFDPVRGDRTMRFSFARSTAEIVEGAKRLKDWRR